MNSGGFFRGILGVRFLKYGVRQGIRPRQGFSVSVLRFEKMRIHAVDSAEYVGRRWERRVTIEIPGIA
jgi:hypothetical protein